MAAKKSAAKLKPKKVIKPGQAETITKEEFFEKGKELPGGIRQLSIKETYKEVVERDVKKYSSASQLLSIKELLKDLSNEKEIDLDDVFYVRDTIIEYLQTNVACNVCNLSLEDMEIEKRTLPNGNGAPVLVKPLVWKRAEITKESSFVAIAIECMLDNIISKYEQAVLQDAVGLASLKDD